MISYTSNSNSNSDSQFHLREASLFRVEPLCIFIPFLRERLYLGSLLSTRCRRTRLCRDRRGHFGGLCSINSGVQESRAEAKRAVWSEDTGKGVGQLAYTSTEFKSSSSRECEDL